MRGLTILGFVLGLALVPESAFAGKYFLRNGKTCPDNSVFVQGPIRVEISEFKSGGMWTNVYAKAVVRNTGTEAADFDPGAFELVRDDGISHFHITHNASVIPAYNPAYFGGTPFVPGPMRPGQAIEGLLVFQTGVGDTKIPGFQVRYGETVNTYPSPTGCK